MNLYDRSIPTAGGWPRTPESRIVTPTARLAAVSQLFRASNFQSIHAPADSSGTASLPSDRDGLAIPRALRGENGTDYTGAGGGGDKFAGGCCEHGYPSLTGSLRRPGRRAGTHWPRGWPQELRRGGLAPALTAGATRRGSGGQALSPETSGRERGGYTGRRRGWFAPSCCGHSYQAPTLPHPLAAVSARTPARPGSAGTATLSAI